MPHLKYNRRKWRVSSDELSIPGLFAIIGRILWSTLLIIILAYSTRTFARCSDGEGMLTYLYLSLLVFVLSLFCEICVVKKSLVGSMVEVEKREEGIGKYLTAHIILGGLQFILAVFGIFVISAHSYIPCANQLGTPSFDLILLSVVVITQLVDITSLMCCCYTFSASENIGEVSSNDNLMSIWNMRIRKIMKYSQIFSCNKLGGSQIEEDLNAVAKVLTNLFHHDGFLDVVPSDVVAGIILVGIQQKERKLPLSPHIENHLSSFVSSSKSISLSFSPLPLEKPFSRSTTHESIRRTREFVLEESREDGPNEERPLCQSSPFSLPCITELDKRSEADRAIVEAGANYVVYTMSIYTHLFAIFMQPCTGVCCLCFSSGWCKKCKLLSKKTHTESPYPCTIKDDNWYGFNHTGLNHLTRKKKSEAIYASYRNDTVAKPFAIFLDHEQKSVVITIRGSFSVEDVITDAIADPVEMTAAGEKWGFDGRGRFAHGGFLGVASHLREDLQKSEVLKNLFDQHPLTNTISRDPDSEYTVEEGRGSHDFAGRFPYAHYKLIVVGHSLGAAAAAILTLFLRPMYPTVHCYGYGMPASVFDFRTASESSGYVTSFILAYDWVPRMTVQTMNKFREEVLDSIARAKVHKLTIIQSLFKNVEEDDVLYRPGEEPDSDFKRCVDVYKDTMHRRVHGHDDLKPPLHLPGRSIHLLKSQEKFSLCSPKPTYTPHFIPSSYFVELLVTPSMLFDHFPDRYLIELTRLWESWQEK